MATATHVILAGSTNSHSLDDHEEDEFHRGPRTILKEYPADSDSEDALQEKTAGLSSLLGEGKARESSVGHDTWRYHKKDWLLGTFYGKAFVFCVNFAALILSGAAFILWAIDDVGMMEAGAFERDGGVGDDGAGRASYIDCLWFSWGLFFDPGTQTGVPPWASLRVKLITLILSVMGFIFNLVFLGLVVEAVRNKLDYATAVYSRIVDNNHTLILGWGDRGLYLLQELVAAYAERRNLVNQGFCCKRRKSIVVLSHKDKLEVQQEIAMYFMKAGNGWLLQLNSINVRQGDPADWKELKKVSACSADDILVLHGDRDEASSDAHVTQCLLALTALSSASTMKVTGEVFAEVHNPENLRLIGAMVGGDVTSGMLLRGTSVRMMCQHCFFPEVGQAIQELLSFTDNHVYVVEMPAKLMGAPFLQASRCYPQAVCVGVKDVISGDSTNRCLVFIAREEPKFHLEKLSSSSRSDVRKASFYSHSLQLASDLAVDFVEELAEGLATMASTKLEPTAGAAPSRTRSRTAVQPFDPKNVLQRGMDLVPPRKAVIVIGAPMDMPLFIKYLRLYANPKNDADKGFDLHVLCDDKAKLKSTCSAAEQECMTVIEGDTSAPQMLRDLPWTQACSVMVLGYKKTENETASATDARSLSTVFQVHNLLKGQTSSEFKVALMCELWDIKSKSIVEQNDMFATAAYYFHSVRAETALFASASDDTRAFNIIMSVVEPNGLDLRCVKAKRFLRLEDDEEMNYWELRVRIKELHSESLLIGWKYVDDMDDQGVFQASRWRVNPEDKDKRYLIDDDSLLLILRDTDKRRGMSPEAGRQETAKLGSSGNWEAPSSVSSAGAEAQASRAVTDSRVGQWSVPDLL